MSNDAIRLSDKHGVNPSMLCCFWCGEAIGVAFVGRLPGDAEAPRKMCNSYDPCDTCKADWDKGIVLIRASTKPTHEGLPPINSAEGIDAYPTGGAMVIKEEGLPRIFSPEACEAILKNRRALLDAEAYDQLASQLTGGASDEQVEDND